MSETPAPATSQREAYLWVVLLSVPPGVGMVGFVSVALAGGAVTPGGVAAGIATTLVIGGLIFATLQFGPDQEPTE